MLRGMNMDYPWDIDYVRENLDTIAKLQADEHLKTSEKGKILARFVKVPKGGLLTTAPSISPTEFHRPVVKVFEKGAELTGRHSISVNGRNITDFKGKVTQEHIKAAFNGLLVLLETYKGNTQRYNTVKSLITEVMISLKKTAYFRPFKDGDNNVLLPAQVYGGGWRDRVGIEGKKGKIIHKLNARQLDAMLTIGIQDLINHTTLSTEETESNGEFKLSEQWIKGVYGSSKDELLTLMPITGQVYQRQASGLCEAAVKDWHRGNLRHPKGGISKVNEIFGGANDKIIDPYDSKYIKIVYDELGKNDAMLFAVSQLTCQGSLISVPSFYLGYNGSDADQGVPPVIFYKNIGLRCVGFSICACRIKEITGNDANRVVIEGVCKFDTNTPIICVLSSAPQNPIGMSFAKDFGIESIRFEAEVSLERKQENKDTNRMVIIQKAIKGDFIIMLNGNVNPKIKDYKPGKNLNLI